MGVYTRYNPLSKPPPGLDQLVRLLRKFQRIKLEGWIQYGEFRSIAQSVDRREYTKPGPSKELRDFLLQMRVFVSAGHDQYFFDSVRADEVVEKCAVKTMPSVMSQSEASQLTALLREVDARKKASAKKSEALLEDAEDTDTSPVEKAQPVATKEVTVADALPVPDKTVEEVVPERILYLMPIENEVWLVLCLEAKKVAVDFMDRVAIPADFEEFVRMFTPDIIADQVPLDAYAQALQKFCSAKIIEEVNGVIKGFRGFKFLVDHRLFLNRMIENRSVTKTNARYIEIVHAIEQGDWKPDQNKGLTNQFEAYATRTFFDVNPATLRMKMCGDVQKRRPCEGWGIIVTESKRHLVCWPGFEPVQFEIKEQPILHLALPSRKDQAEETHTMETTQPEKVVPLWNVYCGQETAKLFLKLAEGPFEGGIRRHAHMPNSLLASMRQREVLIMTGKNRGVTWSFNDAVVQTCRFEKKAADDLACMSNFHIDKTPVDLDQWKRDLEAIANPPVSEAPPVVEVPPIAVSNEIEKPEEVKVPSIELPAHEKNPEEHPMLAEYPQLHSSDEELQNMIAVLQQTISRRQEEINRISIEMEGFQEELDKAMHEQERRRTAAIEVRRTAAQARLIQIAQDRKALDEQEAAARRELEELN